MKVLEVASLNEGIHATLQEIEKIQSQLSGVQRSVRDIIALDQYLKGKTGEAIRSFYKQIHEPFLIYMHQSLTDYAEQLKAIEKAIQAYEPDKNGLIRQEFLDYDVKRSLDRTEDIAGDLIDQANREIASIGDLVSLPRLDISELSFVVQKGRKKTREIVDQLHELDHTQTKNLAKVEEKLDVMKQYTGEMTRTFSQSGQMTHSFDLASIYHLPTLPTLLKSIYGEPVVEEEKEDNFFMKGLKGTGNFIKKTAVTTYDVGIGGGIGLVDVGKDTVVGLYDTITDPIGTAESLYHSVTNPVETYKYIEKSIADSYERDMVNGDAESRSHWVTYALGTTATAVVGTKGAGALTKTGVATTKTAVQKSLTTVPNTMNMMNRMQSSRLAQFLPYGPRTQVALPGGMAFNVINGPVLKENLFMQARKLPDTGTGSKAYLKGMDNGYFYWNKTTEFKSVKVYQRDDIINPHMQDARGRTNLERMKKGLAPLGPDGKSVNLHHTTQRNSSSIAEVTQTFHKENSAVIHINPNTIPSGINRSEFNKWRTDYWKSRSNDF